MKQQLKRIGLLVILFLVVGGNLHAQSKRIVNKRLVSQLDRAKTVYDSIKTVNDKNLQEHQTLRTEIRSLGEQVSLQHDELSLLKFTIYGLNESLQGYGFDPYQICSYSELSAISNLTMESSYIRKMENIGDTSLFRRITDLPDFSAEKLRIQNELLSAKIDEYSKKNRLNLIVLSNQQNITEKLQKLKVTAMNHMSDCEKTKANMMEKYAVLKAKQLEFEAKRKEWQQKTLATSQQGTSKKPTSTTKVNPPVIVEEEVQVDHTLDTYEASEVISVEPEIQTEPVIVEVYEESPAFPGGIQELFKYLNRNVKYPEYAKEVGIEGKVYLKFVVLENGALTKVKIERGINNCPDCNAEALRVIKAMPAWKPAMNNGKPVNVYFTMFVKFELTE